MKPVNKNTIKEMLEALLLNKGDHVLVFSNLLAVGRIIEFQTRDDYSSFYYDLLREKIGPNGTIIVPTYTPDVARYDLEFDRLFTKSQNGLFSEYVRNLDGSFRSDHPLNSVSAIGNDAKLFCEDLGTSNFGWNSPFHRMHEANVRVISLGTCPGVCLGIAHYIEAMCCLPYVYSKLLKWPSYTNGKKDERPFFATVRHLNLNYRLNYTKWALALSAKKQIKVNKVGLSYASTVLFSDAFEVAARELKTNPFFLLASEPDFIYGELPFDGPTLSTDLKSSGGSPSQLNQALAYHSYLNSGTVETLLI